MTSRFRQVVLNKTHERQSTMGEMRPSKKKRLERRRKERERAEQESTEVEAEQPPDAPPTDEIVSGVGGDSEEPPTIADEKQARADARLLARAVRNGWIKLEDLFPVRFDLDAPLSEVTAAIAKTKDPSIRQLMLRNVHIGMMSGDDRSRRIASRTALLMERTNQRDEIERLKQERAEADLKLKTAIVEQRGGNVGDSIPTGVVLLERPSPTMEDWEAEIAEAAKHDGEPIEVPNPE